MHTVRFTRLQGENWVLTQYSWPFCKLKQKKMRKFRTESGDFTKKFVSTTFDEKNDRK